MIYTFFRLCIEIPYIMSQHYREVGCAGTKGMLEAISDRLRRQSQLSTVTLSLRELQVSSEILMSPNRKLESKSGSTDLSQCNAISGDK